MREWHGKKGTKIYRVWSDVKQRCKNPNNGQFKDYGGRGITVCEEWENSFNSFFHDMGEIPFKGAQIDRRNVDGNYTKENCRWVTPSLNMANRRNPVRLLPRGVFRDERNGINKYRSTLRIEKITYLLGYFKTAEEASTEHKKVYKEWYGVCLN